MVPLSRKTRDEIETIAAEQGCRLLAVEPSGSGRFLVLRLVLERAGGRAGSLGECETVSREVSALLDANDEIATGTPWRSLPPDSTGSSTRSMTRRASSASACVCRHDTGHAGALRPAAGDCTPARNLRGELRSIAGDVLTIVDEENRKIYNVRFGDIRSAKLDFPWPQRGR